MYEHNPVIVHKYRELDERFDFVKVYREMPYEYGIQYDFKFAFDLYKTVDATKVNDNAFINCLCKGTSVLDEVLTLTDKNILVRVPTNQVLPQHPRIQYLAKQPDDFWNSFSQYIYYHDSVYWDPSPRLFMEATYYNKEIIYINPTNQMDGSWYRYKEIEAEGLDMNKRNLKYDDEVIQEFI